MENITAEGADPIHVFCRAYGIGKSTAYEEIRAGRLKALKVGKRTLIPRAAARAWLESLPQLQLRSA